MIIKTDIENYKTYLTDASNFVGNCDKIIFPESPEEIRQIVTELNEKNIPFTISGSRTGLTGGAVPENGVLVSMEKFNRILERNYSEQYIWVEPGVKLSEVQETLRGSGFFYPPDPTENNSSIGGNVATNASGAKTFGFGPTRDFVLSLEIILPDGNLLTIKRGEITEKKGSLDFVANNKSYSIQIEELYNPNTSKNAAGFFIKQEMDLIDLFIGSEGLLGVITKIKLKLIEHTNNPLSMVFFVEDESKSFDLVNCIKSENEYIPDLIEYFDKKSLELIKDKMQVDLPAGYSALWVQYSLAPEEEENFFEFLNNLFDQFGLDENQTWVANDDVTRNRIIEFRHSLPLQINEIMSSRNLQKIGTDTCVPDEKFLEHINFIRDAINQLDVDYLVYGHVGNSHLHVNMLPANAEKHKVCKETYKSICQNAVDLGGTISAEHGIGKLKREYLSIMFSEEEIKKMKNIKQTLDPKLLLNKGNLLD